MDLAANPHARSGTSYTDEELEQLVAMTRDGRAAEEMAATVERSTAGLIQRLRRMLPLEYRRCPPDRVIQALREVLADDSYDWRRAMLLSDPPRPVVKQPDVVRTGIAGLGDRDLVTFAYLLIASGRPRETALLPAVSRELHRRWLFPMLVKLREHRIIREAVCVPGQLSLRDVAEQWVIHAEGWEPWGVEIDQSETTSPGSETVAEAHTLAPEALSEGWRYPMPTRECPISPTPGQDPAK